VIRAAAPIMSSAAAPLALVAGWLIGQVIQPASYSPARQTVSVLAGPTAAHPWVMILALVLLGCCHLVTATGLGDIRVAARVLLVVGGVSAFGVVSFPQPPHGASVTHLVFATIAITALTVWPALVGFRSRARSFLLSTRAALLATAAFGGLAAWLLIELHGGSSLGIAECAILTAETMWPLVVVLAIRRQPAKIAT
jgi:hypothetical membrane protein